MKKRLLALVCVLALLISGSAMVASADSTTLNYECPHCKKPVDWEPLNPTGGVLAAGQHHFYLADSYAASATKQISASNAGTTVCLDLHGESFTTSGRSINISASNTVSVMDTVGGGSVNGTAGSNNPGGGTVSVAGGCTFNLHSGTLTFTNDVNTAHGGTGCGGVVALNGASTMNMYDGTIEGADVVVSDYDLGANGCGGTIYVNTGSALNVYGGSIGKGSAANKGDGIILYGATSKLTVANDATIENVYLNAPGASNITVSGTYTGSMGITLNGASSEGLDIGDLTNSGNISGATMTTTDGWVVNPSGTNLVLSRFATGSVAGVIAADGTATSYDTLKKAVDAYKGGYISLLTDSSENITVNKDVTLALNGKDITGTVTVADGATLYGMDSKTDDYTVSDGDYGKITQVVCEGTGKVTGLPAESPLAEDGYLMVKEGEVVSFHRVNLRVYAMTLRAESVGVYYRCNFAGDEKVEAAADSFGITMSVNGTPNADTMNNKNSSAFTDFKGGATGNLGNSYSTLLNNVLRDTNKDLINKRNAALPIYGRAYIKTADGEIAFGTAVCRTLKEQLAGVDARMDSLALTQVQKVVAMYNKFSGLMSNWELAGITEAAGKTQEQLEEDSRLKILVIGNSHGLDATNLLYEVFQDQAPEQNVLIGALYYSGCNMTQHANYMRGNEAEYSYHKNCGQNADRSWTVQKPATALDALQDEQWDIIVLQQMNHRLGMDSTTEYGTFIDDDWQYVIDYVKANQDYTPKFAFHMVWANPDDYALYLNDDAPYRNTASPNWRPTHEKWFAGADGKYDMDVLYESIVSCTQKYVVDTTDFLGEKYVDFVIPSATAIQYAQQCLETPRIQEEIYRDYTHMNDYGRLMVAYLWYAEIMGVEKIEKVGINNIPEVLHHEKSVFPTADSDYAVDEQMKKDIIKCVNWALEYPFELPAE